jgi:hypothetical protein
MMLATSLCRKELASLADDGSAGGLAADWY